MGKMPVFGPILNYFNYVNLYDRKGLAMFGKNLVLSKKQVLTLKQRFCHKLEIACYNLFFFILVKLTPKYQTLL